MQTIKYSSRNLLLYACLAFVGACFYGADFRSWSTDDYATTIAMAAGLILLVFLIVRNTFLEIKEERTLTNSGYWALRRDTVDIFKIKYILRRPNLILRMYGSRMEILVETDTGKLKQTSVREVNYPEKNLIGFLQHVKKINPSIVLDEEYEKILRGDMLTSDSSHNTVESIRAFLKERGEEW